LLQSLEKFTKDQSKQNVNIKQASTYLVILGLPLQSLWWCRTSPAATWMLKPPPSHSNLQGQPPRQWFKTNDIEVGNQKRQRTKWG